jgi:hypothetical protein
MCAKCLRGGPLRSAPGLLLPGMVSLQIGPHALPSRHVTSGQQITEFLLAAGQAGIAVTPPNRLRTKDNITVTKLAGAVNPAIEITTS